MARSSKRKICYNCKKEKGLSAFPGGAEICRSCKFNVKEEKIKQRILIDKECNVCGKIFKRGYGKRCLECAVEIIHQNREKHEQNLKLNKYTIQQIQLLRLFLKVYKRRSKCEYECLYKDYQKYLRVEREQTEAFKLIKKFITEWERIPRSKENFEELYNEVVLFLK